MPGSDTQDRSYYKHNGVETIDILHILGDLPFNILVAIQYLARFDRKGDTAEEWIEDLNKAKRHIEFQQNILRGNMPSQDPEHTHPEWPIERGVAGDAAVLYFRYNNVDRIVLNAHIRPSGRAGGGHHMLGLEVWNSRDGWGGSSPRVKRFAIDKLSHATGSFVDTSDGEIVLLVWQDQPLG